MEATKKAAAVAAAKEAAAVEATKKAAAVAAAKETAAAAAAKEAAEMEERWSDEKVSLVFQGAQDGRSWWIEVLHQSRSYEVTFT